MKTGATTLTDQELLEQFHLDGDNKWLGLLLQRYTLLLLGVCMKYLKDEEEAKDAVQQVFEKCLKELQKYKVDYFKSWIYMVAKNHCLMKLRDKGKAPVPVTEKMISTPADESNVADYIQKEELLNKLSASIPLLGQEQRSCIELFYLQKKSYHEIAASTGYTLMQVKSHIQNGKRNLKMLLQKQTNER